MLRWILLGCDNTYPFHYIRLEVYQAFGFSYAGNTRDLSRLIVESREEILETCIDFSITWIRNRYYD